MDLGGTVGFGVNSKRTEVGSTKTTVTTTSWRIAPYVRYNIFRHNKFSILGKGSTGVFGNSSATRVNSNDPSTSSSTYFFLSVLPLLTYDLSERFTLYTELNFLSLNFTAGGGGTSFKLGADTDNLVNLGNIRVGFVFKF